MAKLKRQLPKNETDNFRMKSNLKSWQNLPQMYFREQENKIAFFNLALPKVQSKVDQISKTNLLKTNNRNEFTRRDDADFHNNGREVNRLDCLEVVKFCTKIRKELVLKNKSAKQFYKFLIGQYVESVRHLGNFCLECHKPIKSKKHFLIDSNEDTRLEKKERMKFRKSKKVGNRKIYFMEKSFVTIPPKGENVYTAKIYGCHLILNERNELANLYEIASFQKIHFVESVEISITVRPDEKCICKK